MWFSRHTWKTLQTVYAKDDMRKHSTYENKASWTLFAPFCNVSSRLPNAGVLRMKAKLQLEKKNSSRNLILQHIIMGMYFCRAQLLLINSFLWDTEKSCKRDKIGWAAVLCFTLCENEYHTSCIVWLAQRFLYLPITATLVIKLRRKANYSVDEWVQVIVPLVCWVDAYSDTAKTPVAQIARIPKHDSALCTARVRSYHAKRSKLQ